MDIKLDPDSLRDVVSSAILKSIDEDKRNTLIEAAIKHLLTPQGGSSYVKAESPLQTAFNNAMAFVARKIAEETLEQNEMVKANITALLQDAMVKVMGENREQTVNKIADAITKGLGADRY